MVEGAPKGFLGKIRQRLVRNAQEGRLRENADTWTQARAEELGIKGQRGVVVRVVRGLAAIDFVHRSTVLEISEIDQEIAEAQAAGKRRKVSRLERKKAALQTIQKEYAEKGKKVVRIGAQDGQEGSLAISAGIGIGKEGADEWDQVFNK